MVLNFMPESISELKMETDKSKGEIVVYQPDEVTRLEVQVDNETVWLAQEQIAMLFGVKRPAITKHIRNIFATQELEERSVCSILERTASDGKTYMTQFYNLDIMKHNSQYNTVNVVQIHNIHDRFLIVDDDVYHIGASLKDLGRKLFAFSRMSVPVEILLGK